MHVLWSCFATISVILVILAPTVVVDTDCDDPFRNHDSPTDCPTVCVKIMLAGTVERGCFENQSPLPVTGPGGSGCVSQYIPMKGMKTICRCSTPRCNGAVGRGSLVYISLLLTGLALVSFLVL
ncbi:uncharacterized protein LOC110462732 isoform X2 [Mizuhopecten yessoensis]|uniref:uncharacterized protein LOC110462732 isoform X2 n=1 Tax=Mizuhopecten yessoensis TaxID=6573 RepID=UPI000B45999F|nr:uncharacterized protein LOC110462732 isoform X2 [Mizuhopecten yessoensis]